MVSFVLLLAFSPIAWAGEPNPPPGIDEQHFNLLPGPDDGSLDCHLTSRAPFSEFYLMVSHVPLLAMSTAPAWMAEEPAFILLPGTKDDDGLDPHLTSKVSFPAFFLIDTTLSTLIVDDGLSIQVELRKAEFVPGKKDTIQRMIVNTLTPMPRQSAIIIPRKSVSIRL